MVRRLYSPLTESKPSPIAMIGTRMLSTSTNDSSVWPGGANSRRNRNGSSAVVLRICSAAK